MKIAVRMGSFTHTMLNASMGVIKISFGSEKPSLRKASMAGAWTIFQSLSQKVRLRTNAIPTPSKAFRMRERNSSRCSKNDIRSMPPSSSSPSESDGGGGGVEPPDPPALAADGTKAVEDEEAPAA